MLSPAEGRFHRVRNSENITGIIDYMHTPDSIKMFFRQLIKLGIIMRN